MMKRYGELYQFKFVSLPTGCPKPIGFRVIDDYISIIALRSYNVEVSTETTSNAIMCDSPLVAAAFLGTFNEYWRNAQKKEPEELKDRAAMIKGGLKKSEVERSDEFIAKLFP